MFFINLILLRGGVTNLGYYKHNITFANVIIIKRNLFWQFFYTIFLYNLNTKIKPTNIYLYIHIYTCIGMYYTVKINTYLYYILCEFTERKILLKILLKNIKI